MNYVGIESAQHANHSRPWNAQRQRGDLGQHPRRHPVHAHAVVDPVGWNITARRVRCDDHDFVTRAAEMLDHPKHRIGHAIHVREEGLCDDRYAHDWTVPWQAFREVAGRDTTREASCQTIPAYWSDPSRGSVDAIVWPSSPRCLGSEP